MKKDEEIREEGPEVTFSEIIVLTYRSCRLHLRIYSITLTLLYLEEGFHLRKGW
jgi:hypothetical protein